jgi:hypothetical protein
MRILLSLRLFISLCIWLGGAWASPLLCHAQMQGLGLAHSLSGSVPQSGHEDRSDRACASKGLISHPPDFTDPTYTCGRCHADQSRWVKRTLMATASGIINQTRFLWGAQPDAGPRYATAAIEGLQLLPLGEGSGALVDDLLRRRCLRCHLGASGPSRSEGPQDATMSGEACAACHIVSGREKIAPDQKLPGAGDDATSHFLTTAVPTSQCLHCHRGNRVGADYAGLFERDHSISYNFEAKDPEIVPHLYSHSYHFLLPDIHYERGMHCIDCHPVEEVMGDGTIHAQSQDQVGIRCTDCHGLPGKAPRTRQVTTADQRALRAARANPRYHLQPGQKVIVTSKDHLLTNTLEENGKFSLISKVDGKKHQIPILAREGPQTGPLDHRIPGHLKEMECATCHAAWTFQDLGLHLVRLDAADYDPWLWLTQQADPQVQQVLGRELVKPLAQRNLPSSFDYLTGRSSPGLWLGGYSRRQWEGIILGLNYRGLVSVLRPQYQYWVSQVDPAGRVLIDSATPTTAAGRAALAWNPYGPHTIRRQTAACWDCHGNPRALGLGQMLIRAKDAQPLGLTRPSADGLGIEFELDQVIDEQGRPLQITTRPGATFLDKPRLERMSASNPLYVKYLLEYYANKEAYGNPAGFTGPKK